MNATRKLLPSGWFFPSILTVAISSLLSCKKLPEHVDLFPSLGEMVQIIDHTTMQPMSNVNVQTYTLKGRKLEPSRILTSDFNGIIVINQATNEKVMEMDFAGDTHWNPFHQATWSGAIWIPHFQSGIQYFFPVAEIELQLKDKFGNASLASFEIKVSITTDIYSSDLDSVYWSGILNSVPNNHEKTLKVAGGIENHIHIFGNDGTKNYDTVLNVTPAKNSITKIEFEY